MLEPVLVGALVVNILGVLTAFPVIVHRLGRTERELREVREEVHGLQLALARHGLNSERGTHGKG